MKMINCLPHHLTIGLAVTVACALGAIADEIQSPSPHQIEGAFGMKLGGTFETAKGVLIESFVDGEVSDTGLVAYKFSPEKPLPPFESYYVQVTPKTHTIFSIFATAHENRRDEKKEQLDVVITALSEKYAGYVYGKDKPNGRFWFYTETKGRNIGLIVGSGQMGKHRLMPAFTLAYRDDSLQELAHQEQKEIANERKDEQQRKLGEKAKTLDKTGL